MTDDVLSVLPTWLRWCPLVFTPAAIAATWVWLSSVAWRARGTLERRIDEHWTERARCVHEARLWFRIVGITIPSVAAVCAYIVAFNVKTMLPLVAAGSAFVAGVTVHKVIATRFERWLRDGHVPRPRVSEHAERAPLLHAAARPILTLLLFFPHLVVVVVVAVAMPSAADATTVWFMVGGLTLLAAALLLMVSGAAVRLARVCALFVDGGDRLRRVVEEVAAETGTEVREVWRVTGSYQANAAAISSVRAVIVTEPALSILDDAELRAVVAHELGHLDERSIASWLRASSAVLVLVPVMFVRPALVNYGMKGYAALVGVMALLVIVRRQYVLPLLRRFELNADSSAVHPEGGAVYARALEKLYEFNLIPAVLRTGVHPSLYDRMVAAGAPPDYPRQRPPRQGRVVALAALSFGIFAFLTATATSWSESAPADVAYDLAEEARLLAIGGDERASELRYRAAETLDAENPWYPLNRGIVLCHLRDCIGAATSFGRACELDEGRLAVSAMAVKAIATCNGTAGCTQNVDACVMNSEESPD
jgi:Zn-dependent protease with chaperone function